MCCSWADRWNGRHEPTDMIIVYLLLSVTLLHHSTRPVFNLPIESALLEWKGGSKRGMQCIIRCWRQTQSTFDLRFLAVNNCTTATTTVRQPLWHWVMCSQSPPAGLVWQPTVHLWRHSIYVTYHKRLSSEQVWWWSLTALHTASDSTREWLRRVHCIG